MPSWRRTSCEARLAGYERRLVRAILFVMRARVIIASLLLFGIPAFAFALKISELDINAGLLFIGSSPPGAPSPLVQTLGISMPIKSDGPFFLEPSIEFFGSYYEVDPITGRTVPAPYESGTSFLTIGSLITLQSGLLYTLSKDIEMGGALGVDFLIRFPFEFQNPSSATNIGDGVTYFYSQGRFIYPETRFITRWHVVEGVTLAFTLRGMYPLFHLWDGESLPFYDQLLVGLDIGFVITFGGKPAKPAAATPAAAQPPAASAPAAATPPPAAAQPPTPAGGQPSAGAQPPSGGASAP